MTGFEKAFLTVAMVLSFVVGRMSVPVMKRDTKIATVEKKSEVASSIELGAMTLTQTKTVTKYVDRIVTKPDGTKIETRTSVADTGRRDETKAVTKAAEVKTEIQTRLEYRDRLVTLQPRAPRFSVGASASMGLDFKPHYGVEIGVRVVGPLWVTLGADVRSRAAVAGIALVF